MKGMLVGHAAFLVVAGGLALMQAQSTTQKKKELAEGQVLLDAKPGAVAKVTYTWPKGTSVITSEGKEKERKLALLLDRVIEKKPEPKKPDEKKPDEKKPDEKPVEAAAPEAPPAPEEREKSLFPPSKPAQKAISDMEPLKARRTLGDVGDERLASMGLEKPERSLVIEAAGKTVTLEIGESTYGGNGRYARVKGERIVHLLEPTLITGLEGSAESLMERKVVPWLEEDITALDVTVGTKKARFPQLDREQAAKRRFAPPDDPDGKSEEARSLSNTLRTLRATKYVDEATLADASPVGAFGVDLDKASPVRATLFEKRDGSAFLLKWDRWVAELSATQGKELLADLQAALGTTKD